MDHPAGKSVLGRKVGNAGVTGDKEVVASD